MNIPWYVKPVAWWLVKSHPVESLVRTSIDVIFSASYGAKDNVTLAAATKQNMIIASRMHYFHPSHPPVVFGSCSHPFKDAERHEDRMKLSIVRRHARRDGACYLVGPITNSVTEMDAWKKGCADMNINPRNILIVTCAMHSHAELILARMIFPGSNIFVIANSYIYEVEADHATIDQTSWLKWTRCSVMRYAAFRFASILPRFDRHVFLDILRKQQHAPGQIRTKYAFPAA